MEEPILMKYVRSQGFGLRCDEDPLHTTFSVINGRSLSYFKTNSSSAIRTNQTGSTRSSAPIIRD